MSYLKHRVLPAIHVVRREKGKLPRRPIELHCMKQRLDGQSDVAYIGGVGASDHTAGSQTTLILVKYKRGAANVAFVRDM